ncbi:MAG: sulfatase family protein [Erysipelotrichaceae bacterium]
MTKPNIIYILADDMGYGDVSHLNKDCAFTTPNLDKLCTSGICFEDAHSSSAVCTPSRYSILTGRYNWRSKLKSSVLGGYSTALIEEDRLTIGNLLQENGYKTAAIGKWHLGMNFAREEKFKEYLEFGAPGNIAYDKKIDKSPITNGFDYFFGISGSLDMPPYVYIENDRFTMMPNRITKNNGKSFWREGPTAPNFVHEEVLDKLTEKVLSKIEEYKEEPFFIYFPLPAPHTPILPSNKFKGKSNTNEYGDFVLHCDDVVGRVMKKLESEGLTESTIVVFTADNGCSPQADYEELSKYGHNPSFIFRGHKSDIYEGGHRIPLLIKWPQFIKSNQRCKEMVCLSDLYATIADYLNENVPDNVAEDSVSNLSLWKDAESGAVRKFIVHQSIDGHLAIRQGHFKLEMCKGSGGWSEPAPGQEQENAPEFQLYDLKNDIGESNNIINSYPETFKEMKNTLTNIIKEGRSTNGSPQSNSGEEIWSAIIWANED